MSNEAPDILSDLQAHLFNKLVDSGDVKISLIFRVLKRRWPAPHETRREQQQAIGTAITRTNRKLEVHGLKIAPGVRRGTYRLTKI